MDPILRIWFIAERRELTHLIVAILIIGAINTSHDESIPLQAEPIAAASWFLCRG
jgi:hypothetical protein